MADDPNWADTLTLRPESHEPEKPKSIRGDLLRSVIEHFQTNKQASPSDFVSEERGRISDFGDLYDAIADHDTLHYDQVRYRDLTPGTAFKFMAARDYDDKMVTCVLLNSKSANGFHQYIPLVSSASRVSVLSDHMVVTIVDL